MKSSNKSAVIDESWKLRIIGGQWAADPL